MPSERPPILLISRAIVFREDGLFLLVKRADDDSYQPGMWEFPGGKLDEGQDISGALEREVQEETGLTIEPIDEIVFVKSRIVEDGAYSGMTYVGIVSLAKTQNSQNLQLSNEHSDAAWVTYKEAFSYTIAVETKRALVALEERINKRVARK